MRYALAPLILASVLGLVPTLALADGATGPVAVGFDDLPVQFTVTDLKRADDGATVMLQGVATNPAAQEADLGHTSDMYLIDFKNRRKYLVIMDSSLACVCAPGGAATVPPGGSLHVWAKFPAPPEGVTTMSFGWGRARPASLQIGK